jgi:hypothetical protein
MMITGMLYDMLIDGVRLGFTSGGRHLFLAMSRVRHLWPAAWRFLGA